MSLVPQRTNCTFTDMAAEWESENLGQAWDPGYFESGPAGYGGAGYRAPGPVYQFGPYVDSVYTIRVGPIARAGAPDVYVQVSLDISLSKIEFLWREVN